MDGENHGLSLITLVVAVVAIGGWLLNDPQPRSMRPVDSGRPEHSNAHSQDIPARLWQDPFEVIQEARRTARVAAPSATINGGGNAGLFGQISSTHATATSQTRFTALMDDLRERNGQIKGNLLVLPVTVWGGNYPESQEWRRRTRYAVVSALIRAGYKPEQPGHIGYVIDPKHADHHPGITDHPTNRRQSIYPYEWFEYTDTNGGHSRFVLVVWVNTDLLGKKPIETMASWQRRLKENIGGKNVPPMRVIGVFGSDTLLKISKELYEYQPPPNVPSDISEGASGLTVLSPTATIDERFLRDDDSSDLSQRWGATLPGSQLIRITNTDAALMRRMVMELHGRKIDPACGDAEEHPGLECAHIALISESDTLYGRSLPQSFIKAVGATAGEKGQHRVHTYSYLRGLDGRVPGAVITESPPVDKAATTSSGAQPGFGDARIDYLERLVDRIQDTDQRLRLKMQGRLRAIGVLGSDVYDKLLILQALRYRFPGIVFFTTDLDARMLDDSNFEWTRNLVVVSDFGLQLSHQLQGNVPPFRSSYQSSTFLAVLLAVRDAEQRQPDFSDLLPALEVRLFEIGRDQAYPLSLRKVTRGTPLKRIAGIEGNSDEPLLLHLDNDVDASASYYRHRWATLTWAVLFSTIIAVLMVNYLQLVIGNLRKLYSGNKTRSTVFAFLLAGYLLVALVSWMFSDWLGEPFTWAGGVSAWPGEITRLTAGVLAIVLLWRTLLSFQQTDTFIDQEYFSFKWATDHHQGARLSTPFAAYIPRRLRLSRICRLFCFSPRHTRNGKSGPAFVNAQREWYLYQLRNRPPIRWLRVAVPTVLFLIVGYLIINVLNGSPPIPVRTTEMQILDKIIIIGLTVTPFLLLLFTVVDSSRSSIALMDGLNRPLTRWPETDSGLRFRMITEHHFVADDLDEWLDVKLSADLTDKLGNIIYFPFLIIFLMLISRLTYFDNWTMPGGLVAIISISAFYAIYCSVNLQFAARRVRQNALDHLNQRRIQVHGQYVHNSEAEEAATRESRVEQIDFLIRHISELKMGAFRRWHQQPVIKALLLLLSSASIFAIDMLSGH